MTVRQAKILANALRGVRYGATAAFGAGLALKIRQEQGRKKAQLKAAAKRSRWQQEQS
jgi:hypothetical protein